MIDDGTAGNVQIPSYLVSREDGERIKQVAKSTKSGVGLMLSFEIPHPGNKVNYSIWMTSDHFLTRAFLHNFASYAE